MEVSKVEMEDDSSSSRGRPLGWAGQCGVNFIMPKRFMDGGKELKKGEENIEEVKNTKQIA